MLCALLLAVCSAAPLLPPTAMAIPGIPQDKPASMSHLTVLSTATRAGTGTIAGRLVYQASAQPASGYRIGLGTANFQGLAGTAPFRAISWTESDHDGYFAFSNVTVGEWIVAVDNPLTSVFYPWERVTVSVGETTTIELKQIDKDLKLVSPSSESVIDAGRPILRWASYPNAISYKVKLYHVSEDNTAYDVSKYVLPFDTSWTAAHAYISPYDSLVKESGITTDTEMRLLQDLPPGWYQWSVTALDMETNTWAYCDCGGSSPDNNYSRFGIRGDKSLVAWLDNYDYSDTSQLSIYNYTGQELTLAITDYGTVSVSSDAETRVADKTIDISADTYLYTATVPVLPQISGTIVIAPEGPQVLKFYVSSSVSQ